ncbi:MAG: DUF4128 domain-containing protein [Pseudomonadaceae bacterium]|nr:DUF4128 domain-containing protein [Pseudomonadaceae bacterium]
MTAAVASQIRSRFNDQWATFSPTYRVVFAGVPTQLAQINNVPWVRLTVLPGAAQQIGISIAGKRKRIQGTASVQVFTPAGQGDGLAQELCDRVADCWEMSTINGLIFRATSVRRIGESDAWLEYLAETNYQADVLVPIS